MKAYIILLLIVGTVSVLADPVSKQANSSNNKEPPLSETSESEVKPKEETTSNKSESEPNTMETSDVPAPDAGEDSTKFGDGEVDIVIEENVTPLEVDISDALNVINTETSEIPAPDAGEDSTKFGEGEVDIVIEENVTPLEVDISDAQNDINIDDDDYLSPGDRLVDNILVDRIKDEIMETAAGFAPIPLLFRKKHKQPPPRRRFAIRRQFQRYPYAPHRRLPFYYPYYRFYRPSSLRFY